MGLGKCVSHCVGGMKVSTGESSVVKRWRLVEADDGGDGGVLWQQDFTVSQIN